MWYSFLIVMALLGSSAVVEAAHKPVDVDHNVVPSNLHGIYQHYKGNYYEVIGTVNHSETLEKMVLYRALYDAPGFGSMSMWVRPMKMFLERVEVDGQERQRFQRVCDRPTPLQL